MSAKSPIIGIAKKVCPAVITVIVSKDLPKAENFYSFPFAGKEYVMPKLDKGQKGQIEKIQIGGGSGFIVSKDGFVMTSNHVVSDTTADYTVIVDPKHKYPAKVLSRNPINDTAVLKIVGNGDFPYLDMADSNDIELGEEVVAVGNALGEFTDTLSAGIVSGLSRFITAFLYSLKFFSKLLIETSFITYLSAKTHSVMVVIILFLSIITLANFY